MRKILEDTKIKKGDFIALINRGSVQLAGLSSGELFEVTEHSPVTNSLNAIHTKSGKVQTGLSKVLKTQQGRPRFRLAYKNELKTALYFKYSNP